jgi:hypothetical protein
MINNKTTNWHKRRLKEFEKIMKTGTTTEYYRGLKEGIKIGEKKARDKALDIFLNAMRIVQYRDGYDEIDFIFNKIRTEYSDLYCICDKIGEELQSKDEVKDV